MKWLPNGEKKVGNLTSPKKSNSWIPLGVILLILGFVLLGAGSYADRYVRYGSTWSGGTRDWATPYKDYSFPLYVVGACCFLTGVFSIIYGRRL